MRAVLQRVSNSKVSVDNKVVGQIQKGLTIFVGIGLEDTIQDIDYLVSKIINLRIFEDNNDKMNLSLVDVEGELLIISQFTLYGDCRKGRRPNFTTAAPPYEAEKLYKQFVKKCKQLGIKNVQTGIFGADMQVEIHNDGPVTIVIDSKKVF